MYKSRDFQIKIAHNIIQQIEFKNNIIKWHVISFFINLESVKSKKCF